MSIYPQDVPLSPAVGETSDNEDNVVLHNDEQSATELSLISHPSALVQSVPQYSRIPYMLSPFPGEAMTSEDWRFLQKLLQSDLSDCLGVGSKSVVVARNINWHQYKNPHPVVTAFPWPSFPLSSVTFRYASLTFASYSGTKPSSQTLRYLGKFYKLVQEAILSSSLVEVVAACYPILLYEYVSRAPFKKVFVHFKGLCGALVLLRFEKLSVPDRKQLQNIWQGSLPALRRAYWTSHAASAVASAEELNVLQEIYDTFQSTSFMLDTNMSQDEHRSHQLRSRLHSLECYLVFYWDYYLAMRGRTTESPCEDSDESSLMSLETSIRDIVHLIYAFAFQQKPTAALITQVSKTVSHRTNFLDYPDVVLPVDAKFEHIKAAFLYCWAKIIDNVLLSSTVSAGSVLSSLVLLRLAKCVFQSGLGQPDGLPWSLTHSIFWSGLSLTHNTCPSGNATANLKLIAISKKLDHSQSRKNTRSTRLLLSYS